MTRTIRYISMVMLLLFIFTIGGRAVVSIVGCHCVEDIIYNHHCCSCEDHVDDCITHTQTFDSDCVSYKMGLGQIEALSSDVKFSSLKRYLFITILSNTLYTEEVEEITCSDHREHEITVRTIGWICDVGLLRAPPMC